MIHTFKARRVLAVPSNWLNSVAAWCLGVSSPEGTITVKNTACPKQGNSSLELDVNIEKVAKRVEESIGSQRELSQTERALIKGLFASMFDQKIVIFKNNLVGLDITRLVTALEDYFPQIQPNESADDAANAPSADGTKLASEESDTEKRTRIGKSEYASRSDHKHPLNCDDTNTPEDVVHGSSASASCGTATTYARADHVHKLGSIDATDITYGSGTVGSQLDSDAEDIGDHESRIAALEAAEPVAGGVSSVNTKTGDVTLTASDINATGGTIQSVLSSLDEDIEDIVDAIDGATGSSVANLPVMTTADGKITAMSITADSTSGRCLVVEKNGTSVTLRAVKTSDIKDTDCADNHNCFAVVGANGVLTHSQASGEWGVQVRQLAAVAGAFSIGNDGALATRTAPTATLSIKAAGASGSQSTQKALVFEAGSTVASLAEVATVDTATSSTAGTTVAYLNGKFVVDGNKYLKATTSSTGVVYLTAGVMSMKALNGANGVAGLDANSKVAIGNLPTGTSATTVALGNHTHAYGDAALTGFGTAAAKDTTYFAQASHTHGYITADGCLSNCTSANCLVVTTTGGKITHSNSGPTFSDVAALVKAWNDAGKKLGEVTSVDGQTGAVSLSNTYAEKSHKHTTSDITGFSTDVNSLITSALNGYATESYVTGQLSSYATSSEVDALSDSLSELVDIVSDIAADYVTSGDLTSYATQDWVTGQGYVTDEDLGEYLTTDDISQASISALSSGVASATIKVVTEVSWNGTALQYKYKNITVTKGIITSVPSSVTTVTVDTPTVITWS